MTAKIVDVDCQSRLGYAQTSKPQCRAVAHYKIKDTEKERSVILFYDIQYAETLREYMNNNTYGFISCIYSDHLRKLFDCSIK